MVGDGPESEQGQNRHAVPWWANPRWTWQRGVAFFAIGGVIALVLHFVKF